MTDTQPRSVLTTAFITEYPFSYRDAGGSLTGFDVVLLHEVARRMRIERVDWVEIQWHEVVPALREGRFDVIVTGLAWHADRMAAGLPSEPLYCVRSAGFVPKGNPERIHSVEDMAKASGPVGSIIGSLELKVMKRVLGEKARGYHEEAAMWMDLESGSIRAVSFAESAGLGYITAHPGTTIEPVEGFDFPILPETGWFLRRHDVALKAEVDSHIRAIKEQGLLATTLRRFGYPPELALPPGATAQSNLEADG